MVGMKKAFVFDFFIVGVFAGAILVMLVMAVTKTECVKTKALINHGLASYNQTTGKFICDICKE